ncbi:MAG: tetratricopeptide repeat protein, partial [Planctomycetota bacterium]
VNFYRQKCFSCHTNQSCEDPQGTKAEADCIGCHMPARVTTDVVNVTMTDHKVSRFINTQALLEPLDEIDVPIEMPIREFNYDKSEEKQADKVYEYFARALDDDESVLAQFDQHLTGAPETNSPAKLQLTQKLLQSQEFERANDWLNKLQDSNLNSLSLFHTNAGVLAMGLGQLDVAIKELKQAVEIDPQDAAARYNLGIAFDKTGRRSVAIEHLKKSIEVRPNYVKPMLKLGSLFALANNFESAAKYFEDAIAIDVRNLEAFNKLSAVRRRQGHWQEAIALLKDAHQVDPGDQRTSQNLCLTLIEQGNVEHRDPDLANRVVKGIFSAEFDQIDLAILSALIEVEINQPRVALDTIAPLMEKGQRQAELGLIIAMAQKSLGSDDAAQANYQGAKAALKSSQYGRLGRVILEIANSKFAE